jgi:ATP-dependent Clp protease ATP-binding subunit ClpA
LHSESCPEGARPLRRTIERRIANPLSRRILEGVFKEGDTAVVDYVDGEFVFGKQKPARKREKVAARA